MQDKSEFPLYLYYYSYRYKQVYLYRARWYRLTNNRSDGGRMMEYQKIKTDAQGPRGFLMRTVVCSDEGFVRYSSGGINIWLSERDDEAALSKMWTWRREKVDARIKLFRMKLDELLAEKEDLAGGYENTPFSSVIFKTLEKGV